MTPTPTPITDLLDLVVKGEAHRSSPARPEFAGGEWDPWYALPLKRRKQLIGSRRARMNACPPDELADIIRANCTTLGTEDPLEWYFRMCRLALAEGRVARRRDRRASSARRAGFPTEYALRNHRAVQDGYGSLWRYRKAKGWS